ncbi:hypothetical protein Tco_0385055 [Tanacetum coccineum]
MAEQQIVKKFWSTAVAFDPFSSTDEPEKCPLKEFLINHRALRLQEHSLRREKKPKFKRPPTETKESQPKPTEGSEQSHSVSSGTVPDPQDLERDIQLASMGLPSTLNEGTRQSKTFPEGTATHPKDSRGTKHPLDRDINSITSNEGTAKTTPRPEGSLGDKDSGGKIPPTYMEPIHTPVTDPSGTCAKYQKDETQSTRLRGSACYWDDIDEDPRDDKEHEEAAVSYADLKAFVDQYYDENIAHRDQTDKLVEASMSSLDRNSTTISDLYKGLNVITQLLKDISNAVKDNPAINLKLDETTKTFARISSNVTKKEEASTSWIKSSTNMAWNLGSRMTGVKLSQTALKREISSLRQDTSEIKSMMSEVYAAFQGQPSSAPSGSVTPTLALINIQANVEGENANTTATEEPPYHTEGETKEPRLAILISSIPSTVILPTQAQPITSIIIHPESSQATPKIDKGKGIAIEFDDDPSKKLVKASSIVHPDLDEPVRVEFMINGKIVYLIEQEIQDYWDKEE